MSYKILVVDDEAHYADMLRDLLLQNNFIADMATTANQAMELLNTEDYALIIADYKMPGVDGAEFLQRVRGRDATIPFFMVSGLMNTHELIRVANLGATLVFEKPLEISGFIKDVRRYVEPLSEEEFGRRFRSDVTGENYPTELIRLSDKSPLGRNFVHRLWSSCRLERLAVVEIPPGGELELVAKEISHWKGRPNGRCYSLSPEDFTNDECAEALNDALRDPTMSPVVLIEGLDHADPTQLEAMSEFMFGRHFAPRLHPDLFFLVVLRPQSGGRAGGRDALRILRSRAIELPPLRERPSDIARHAMRLLAEFAALSGDAAKARLTPEAVGLLLQHRWAGEYDELSTKLEQVVTLDRPSPLTAHDFASILAGEEDAPRGGYTLARRLMLEQETLVARALAETGGSIPLAIARLGLPASRTALPAPGEALHPELLA